MFSFLETNIKADYSKLAYDYKFNDIDGNDLNLKGQDLKSKCQYLNGKRSKSKLARF